MGYSLRVRGQKSSFAWTTIPDLYTVSGDDVASDHIYYVSAIGNDANDGRHPTTIGSGQGPLRTVSVGVSKLRDGHGDRLLLRKGDTFDETLIVGGNWSKSGESPSRPMIIGSYGSGSRPVCRIGTSRFWQNAYLTPINDLWFIGLEVYGHTFNGTTSTGSIFNQVYAGSDGILVEDCYFHNFGYGLTFDAYIDGVDDTGRSTNMRIRGCTIADIYRTNDSGEVNVGLFCAKIDGLTVEYCTFDKCGWDTDRAGSVSNLYRRAIYLSGGPISHCTSVVVQNNIALRTQGFQIRPGGVVTGNVLSRVNAGIVVGYDYDMWPMGVTYTVEDNVISELMAGPSPVEDTMGISFCNNSGASSISRNIICNTLDDDIANTIRCIWQRSPFEDGQYWPVVGAALTFSDNICYYSGIWYGERNQPNQYTGAWTLNGNDFQCNAIAATWSPFNFAHTDATDAINGHASGNAWFCPNLPEASWFNVTGAAGNPLTVAEFSTLIGDGSGSNTAVAYADPTVSLGKYYQSIGGTDDHDAFCAVLRSQSKDSWTDAYTAPAIVAYFKQGFT